MSTGISQLLVYFNEIKQIMSKFWIPPSQMEQEVGAIFKREDIKYINSLVISGETDNISLYILSQNEALIITPFQDVRLNKVLLEIGVMCDNRINLYFSNNFSSVIVSPIERLLKRIEFPKILFVNLSVIENFPVPRLSLGIASLASYIRRLQIGKVEIIDMQMGVDIEKVLETIRDYEPNLICLSISYGQKFLAFELLEAIEKVLGNKSDTLIEAGNIIPASSPEEFLKKFPRLLISRGEGELTLLGIIKHIVDGLPLERIEGLIYMDDSGGIQKNPLGPLPIEDQPLPALDTLEELVKRKGALTLELSRGCQYNVCSFCPRTHKANKWKGMAVNQALTQLELMAKVANNTGLPGRIFLADEEFVGSMEGNGDTDRVIAIADGIISRNLNIQIDTEARVDQVYNPRRTKQWHIHRMAMWRKLKECGLHRLFMGIESGCVRQLKRFAKGTNPEQSVIAVRILSSLGIGLRSGFIMFDPLMIGFDDLVDNINFLDRTDALMNTTAFDAVNSLEELFVRVTEDKCFVEQHSKNKPLYSIVSYMLATLEVLINSPYKRMVEKYEKYNSTKLLLDREFADTNMGRHHIAFADKTLGIVSNSCQKWIDRNFALSYSLKSFYKTASKSEREMWMKHMVKLREISQYLLKTIVFVLSPDSTFTFRTSLEVFHGTEFDVVTNICKQRGYANPQESINQCLALFESRVNQTIDRISKDLDLGKLSDNEISMMKTVIFNWRENMGQWKLINE